MVTPSRVTCRSERGKPYRCTSPETAAVRPSCSSTFFQSISCAFAALPKKATAQIAITGTTRISASCCDRLRPHPSSIVELLEDSVSVPPVDHVHENVDVTSRFGTEVDVIGVLVHVQRENRNAPGQSVAVICGPLIDELLVARRPGQQHPAGSAGQRLAHCDKLTSPPVDRSEISRQCFFQCGAGLAGIPPA